jgi:hypothetical protein
MRFGVACSVRWSLSSATAHASGSAETVASRANARPITRRNRPARRQADITIRRPTPIVDREADGEQVERRRRATHDAEARLATSSAVMPGSATGQRAGEQLPPHAAIVASQVVRRRRPPTGRRGSPRPRPISASGRRARGRSASRRSCRTGRAPASSVPRSGSTLNAKPRPMPFASSCPPIAARRTRPAARSPSPRRSAPAGRVTKPGRPLNGSTGGGRQQRRTRSVSPTASRSARAPARTRAEASAPPSGRRRCGRTARTRARPMPRAVLA